MTESPESAGQRRESRIALILALFMGGMGTLHFVMPKPFDTLIPKSLPGSARAWTYGSGVAEMTCGAAVAIPKTRRLGALLTALLFIGVFPGNIKMAMDYQRPDSPLPLRIGTLLRLPLQIPLVLWALRVRNKAAQG